MSLIMTTDHTAKGKGRLISLDEITILDWIKNLIPPRTDDEQRQLLENLEDSGQNTPVIVTKIGTDEYVLVDGHGRYEALKQIGEDSIWVISQKFKDEQDIKDTMLRIQLGRRNLSENVRIRLIGEIWNRTKQVNAGHSDPTTRKDVADQCNTSESTVKRAGSYASYVESIIKIIPSAKTFLDDPTTPRAIAKPISEIAQNNPEKAREIITLVAAQKTNKTKNKVFKDAIKADRKDIADKSGQADPTYKKPKSQKIALSAEIVEMIAPIAKANSLSLSTQIENFLREHLSEIND